MGVNVGINRVNLPRFEPCGVGCGGADPATSIEAEGKWCQFTFWQYGGFGLDNHPGQRERTKGKGRHSSCSSGSPRRSRSSSPDAMVRKITQIGDLASSRKAILSEKTSRQVGPGPTRADRLRSRSEPVDWLRSARWVGLLAASPGLV